MTALPRRPRLPFAGTLPVAVALAFAALLAAVLAPRPAAAVDIRQVISPGGIEGWLVEDRTNPLIALRVAFRGGSAMDPVGKEGLADMTSALLDEGAGDYDSQTFQGLLQDRSIRLGFDAGRDAFYGSVQTLSANRDEAFRLLRLAISEPRFDTEPVTRIRSQLLARLRQAEEDPDSIANRTLTKTLFPDHPYGRPSRGTPESIAAIGTDDLKGFVRSRFGRNNLVIGAVGDISPADFGRLIDATFGGLPPKASLWTLAEVTPKATGATIVERKDVPQSAIVFAQPGLKRDDPDFYTLFVLNHLLGGGGFTSRLYSEVREKRGLVYSIGTGLIAYSHTGLIWGAAGTQNARVAETLEVVRQEWARMAKGPVTAEELADAKSYLTGSYALGFSSSDRIADTLVSLQIDRLGIDYIDKRNGYIEAVTADDVNRLARKLLKPDQLTVVVVGQPVGVESSAPR